MRSSCFFARFHPSPCDGRTDPAHLIPQQRLRQAGITDHDELWDERIIVPACRHHHSLFDRKFLRLEQDRYPLSVFDYASEFGFFWGGERDGWLAEARAA